MRSHRTHNDELYSRHYIPGTSLTLLRQPVMERQWPSNC